MRPNRKHCQAGPTERPIRKFSWVVYEKEDGIKEGVVIRSYYLKKSILHLVDLYDLENGVIKKGLRAKYLYNSLIVCV